MNESVYIDIYAYIYTCTYIYKYIYTHMYMYIYKDIYIHTHTHTHTHTHVHTHIYIYTYTYIYNYLENYLVHRVQLAGAIEYTDCISAEGYTPSTSICSPHFGVEHSSGELPVATNALMKSCLHKLSPLVVLSI